VPLSFAASPPIALVADIARTRNTRVWSGVPGPDPAPVGSGPGGCIRSGARWEERVQTESVAEAGSCDTS
jgi:hypothetical protein